MNDNKIPNNVIQFPGAKRKEAEANASKPTPTPNQPPQAAAAVAVAKPSRRGRKAKAVTAGTVFAIMFATGAVNRYAFQGKVDTMDASSLSDVSRTIASVEQISWQRDAGWEKNLAESLASAQVRAVASTGIGHPATMEEKLRWGTLEEKYTIVFKTDVHNIDSIFLQDATSNPAYILDRNQFLRDYGPLLHTDFSTAKLKSVEVSHEKTVELYTLFGKDQQPKGEARFELDTHKRLLSLKVEPTQI